MCVVCVCVCVCVCVRAQVMDALEDHSMRSSALFAEMYRDAPHLVRELSHDTVKGVINHWAESDDDEKQSMMQSVDTSQQTTESFSSPHLDLLSFFAHCKNMPMYQNQYLIACTLISHPQRKRLLRFPPNKSGWNGSAVPRSEAQTAAHQKAVSEKFRATLDTWRQLKMMALCGQLGKGAFLRLPSSLQNDAFHEAKYKTCRIMLCMTSYTVAREKSRLDSLVLWSEHFAFHSRARQYLAPYKHDAACR